jgi:hypothetical protein
MEFHTACYDLRVARMSTANELTVAQCERRFEWLVYDASIHAPRPKKLPAKFFLGRKAKA